MSGKPFPGHQSTRAWLAMVILLTGIGPLSSVSGQTKTLAAPPIPDKISLAPEESKAPAGPALHSEGGIVQTGCSSCAGGLASTGGDSSDCSGCSSGSCLPGRKPCACCCDTDTCLGRLVNGFYQSICCPDPCYDPHWMAVADSAFFTDAARPQTQMRLRVNKGWEANFPDRAEYFWPRENTGVAPFNKGRGPHVLVNSVNFSDVSLYTEAATGRAGLFFEVPYRRVEDPVNGSGFSDMNVGTKAMLLDSELLQITFQFKTFLPVGDGTKGLGTRHVSLEPAFLWGLRLAERTYLQSQTALWIPIGGDPDYEGNVFHYHFSLNHVLWRPCPDVQLVGSAELAGWSILNGLYTDPAVPFPLSAKRNLLSMGPGLRCVICDKIDFGVGSLFSVTDQTWAEELLRVDFRWRF